MPSYGEHRLYRFAGLACDLQSKLQASARGKVDNAPRIAYFVVLQRDLSHHSPAVLDCQPAHHIAIPQNRCVDPN